MKKLLTASAVALAVAAAGCGGGGETAPVAASGDVPFDRAFIDAMVPHHQSAIDMAEAAKTAGLTQPDLIEIADDIETTQRAEIDQMRGWREAWFGSAEIDPNGARALGLPEPEMGMMEHAADELEGADDVDQAFAEAMIEHHEGAIAMASLAQEEAGHGEIRELAAKIIEAQEREITVMQRHVQGEHD